VSHLAAPYLPRRPQETVLYALVKAHLPELLAHARETYEAPLPKYVEDEFRGYLRCGDFARGFVHTQCTSCGDSLLVAFSCKRRGACPSCAGRRMAGAAAHLVDAVLPQTPMRQYVLSFPYELSGLAATRAEVLTYLSRVFWEAVRARYRRWAKDAGYTGVDIETGAVTGVHRAGSSLNLHVHFHMLVLDGVYAREGDALSFVPAPTPTHAELADMVVRIHARVMKWLARRGLLRDPDASNDTPALSPAEAVATMGMQRGTLATVREDDGAPHEDEDAAALATRPTGAVTHERFNLHAAVTLRADDDTGRERLCRYLTRPAFSLGRIHLRKDGAVTYRVKKLGRRRATHRVMTRMEFLARLAAILPPPRYPLLRLHGVLAPRHKWRARVVPRTPAPVPRCAPKERKEANTPSAPTRPTGDGRAAFVMPEVLPTCDLEHEALERVAPNILSVAHWARIGQGALYAATSRAEWAILLARTFQCDIRVCLRCGGKLVVRAVISERDTALRVLQSMRRSRAPPSAPP
jgi:hypothetical protein